jgi:hypothetical protein
MEAVVSPFGTRAPRPVPRVLFFYRKDAKSAEGAEKEELSPGFFAPSALLAPLRLHVVVGVQGGELVLQPAENTAARLVDAAFAQVEGGGGILD